jgi:hypothetical protein
MLVALKKQPPGGGYKQHESSLLLYGSVTTIIWTYISYLYLKQHKHRTNNHAFSGTGTHDPRVRAKTIVPQTSRPLWSAINVLNHSNTDAYCRIGRTT